MSSVVSMDPNRGLNTNTTNTNMNHMSMDHRIDFGVGITQDHDQLMTLTPDIGELDRGVVGVTAREEVLSLDDDFAEDIDMQMPQLEDFSVGLGYA